MSWIREALCCNWLLCSRHRYIACEAVKRTSSFRISSEYHSYSAVSCSISWNKTMTEVNFCQPEAFSSALPEGDKQRVFITLCRNEKVWFGCCYSLLALYCFAPCSASAVLIEHNISGNWKNLTLPLIIKISIWKMLLHSTTSREQEKRHEILKWSAFYHPSNKQANMGTNDVWRLKMWDPARHVSHLLIKASFVCILSLPAIQAVL